MAPETLPSGYLFLDVDGILNPEAWTLDGDWRTVSIGRYEVWVSDELSGWLNSLVDHGIQIVWATTWIEVPTDLALLAELFGLPDNLPRIDRLEWEPNDGIECGKRLGVRRWLEQHTIDPRSVPVAWADDQLGISDRAWADQLGIHAIKVPPRSGLSDPVQRERIGHALALVPSTS